MSRIPDSYERATWRGTLPADKDASEIGLSFQKADGEIVRLALPIASARSVVASLDDYVGKSTCSHSDSSSGNPQSAVSMPEKGIEQ